MIVVAACSASAETISVRMVGVADGDTITVLDGDKTQHKISVAGINAPEKTQPFGQRSKASMSTLVHGKDVEVVTGKHDRYGRTVEKVLVADPSCQFSPCAKTLDAGHALITMGLAWWYRKYAHEQSTSDSNLYELAVNEAQVQLVGLCADAHLTPPWDWRHTSHR